MNNQSLIDRIFKAILYIFNIFCAVIFALDVINYILYRLSQKYKSTIDLICSQNNYLRITNFISNNFGIFLGLFIILCIADFIYFFKKKEN